MWFSSSWLCKAATELVLFFSLIGITLPVKAEAAIATNQAAAAQGITTADSRIHYVIGIGSALVIGNILGNVVYFWRRAERIERELDELREQRIARARGKIEENDDLFVRSTQTMPARQKARMPRSTHGLSKDPLVRIKQRCER